MYLSLYSWWRDKIFGAPSQVPVLLGTPFMFIDMVVISYQTWLNMKPPYLKISKSFRRALEPI
jgi:hypothetical protein